MEFLKLLLFMDNDYINLRVIILEDSKAFVLKFYKFLQVGVINYKISALFKRFPKLQELSLSITEAAQLIKK